MTCQQVQTEISLYLYGELDFSREEELESHLESCSLCQMALDREKSWHSSLNAERDDVSLDLLAQCRNDLRGALRTDNPPPVKRSWRRTFDLPIFSASPWSSRLAFASLFVFIGFTISRGVDRLPASLALGNNDFTQAGLLTPGISRVRNIQPGEQNSVRILVDRIQEQEIVGDVDDEQIRRLLLQASKDSADPGLRVDSVEMLNRQSGSDIRDALLFSVRHDGNAAVRLKALEGLRRFSADRATRDTLRAVLESDESPAVRAEAIDVLVPANTAATVGPDLASTLQMVIASEPSDDYLRARCLQILRAAGQPGIY